MGRAARFLAGVGFVSAGVLDGGLTVGVLVAAGFVEAGLVAAAGLVPVPFGVPACSAGKRYGFD